MFNILIKNGTIVDGTGAPGKKADLAVSGDKIAAIEPLSHAEAELTIDAQGLVVAPGFIDIHSHSDSMLPFLPSADSKVCQGITTEVVGNCGDSIAPLSPTMLKELNESLERENAGRKVTWSSFKEYVDVLRTQGTAVNTVNLVGHGTIREKVMGMTDAAPTPAQIAEMQDEVKKAMDAGARGLTSGLIYTPSVYAKTDELIALARTATEKNGIYTTHMRGEGNTLFEAIEEAILTCRAAEVPLEISHLKASGVRNWDKMPRAIEMIEKARAEGLDVTADMYPYPASNTGLGSLIPDWAHVGGRDTMIARLQDPSMRARIHQELADPLNSNGTGYDKIFISSCAVRPEYEGRNIQEIADERRRDALDTVMDILVEVKLSAEMIMFTMKEENVVMGLRQPFVSIGTDASCKAYQGPLAMGKPHPRAFGTFARVLGKFSRDEKLFSVEEAVRKMTGLPAGKFNLQQRGLLKAGYFADITLFDPKNVADNATFTNPQQVPTGIPWVIVNGQIILNNGHMTGTRPGKVL